MILEHIWVVGQAQAKVGQARLPRDKARKAQTRLRPPSREATTSTVRNRWLEPLVVFVAASPSLYGASERTTRAWSNPMIPHPKDQAASCTCHHPAALWAWRSAGSLCSWLWCGDADTCCCMSVAQIGGFHCQSFVDVGLSLSFKVLWNLRFVLRGTHSLPTPHAYPRFQERGFCHSRQRRDTRDERGHRFGSDRRDFASWRSYGTPASFRAELHDEEGHGCSGSRVAGRKS